MNNNNLDVTFGSHDEDELTETQVPKLSHYLDMEDDQHHQGVISTTIHQKKADARHQMAELQSKLIEKGEDKYGTIKFKKAKAKQVGKALYQTASKMYHFGRNTGMNPTDQEIFSKVVVVKNPYDYESEEKMFNFKQRTHQHSPSMGGGFKMHKNTSVGDMSGDLDSGPLDESHGLHKSSTTKYPGVPGVSKMNSSTSPFNF
jgi:hypothetical protein